MVPPDYLNNSLPDQGSSEAVPFADRCGINEPQIPFAVAVAQGIDDPLLLHVYHHSMDCALMAAGIHSHTPHDVGAGLGTILDQGGADSDAGQSRKVHWIGLNCVYPTG